MELKKIKEIKIMQLKLDVLVSLRKKMNRNIKELNSLIPKLIRDLEIKDATGTD